MLSTIFLVGSLSQPPTAVNAHPKPVQPVERPSPYSVEARPGFNPVRLPSGYPKDLQWQFHKNYRRDDQ